MADRDAILSEFLSNELLLSVSDLTPAELERVTFSHDSDSPVVESVKRLITAYEKGEADATLIRNVNAVIKRFANDRESQ